MPLAALRRLQRPSIYRPPWRPSSRKACSHPSTRVPPEPAVTTDRRACGRSEAGGILTIDLGASSPTTRCCARRVMPAECAAVVKGDAYGCGIDQVTTALTRAGCQTFFVAHLSEARRVRAIAPRGGDLCAQRLFLRRRPGLRRDLCAAGDQQPGRARRVGPLRLGDRLRRQRRAPCRHRHEPARPHHRGGGGDRRPHPLGKPPHHAVDEPPRLRRPAGASAERSADPAVPRNPLAVSRHLQFARQLLRHLPRRLDLLRPGAPRHRALRRQSDAGQAQSDAAGDRAQGAHPPGAQRGEGRHGRLRRHLDRQARQPDRRRSPRATPTASRAPPRSPKAPSPARCWSPASAAASSAASRWI